MGNVTEPRIRKRLLITSLTINLGLLAFFKYSNFFLANMAAALNASGWHVGAPHLNIILPPAISFFTFTSMAYVLDVYFEKIPVCENARDYALFITFFPKLLSGPIVRGNELFPQFKECPRVTAEDVEIGLSYCLIGAVKKLVIADQIAGPVSQIFATPAQFDGLTLLMGVMGYTAQLYCDFAGYSDIAIGTARILGYRLPENFQMPLSSKSITEFWRRWHISLSRWFRDYLFLPLEIATRNASNRLAQAALNIIFTMLLCGLWHGASWNFVIFGGIHGAGLAAHTIWTKWKPLEGIKKSRAYAILWGALAHFLTMTVVLLGFVFFRSETYSDATLYLSRMLSWSHSGIRLNSPYIMGGVAAVVLAHLVIRKDRNLAVELPTMPLVVRLAAYTALLTVLVLLGASEAAPFIYFKF